MDTSESSKRVLHRGRVQDDRQEEEADAGGEVHRHLASAEERQQMIAVAAYFLSQSRNFEPDKSSRTGLRPKHRSTTCCVNKLERHESRCVPRNKSILKYPSDEASSTVVQPQPKRYGTGARRRLDLEAELLHQSEQPFIVGQCFADDFGGTAIAEVIDQLPEVSDCHLAMLDRRIHFGNSDAITATKPGRKAAPKAHV